MAGFENADAGVDAPQAVSVFPEVVKKPLPPELVVPERVKDEHLYKFLFLRTYVEKLELLIGISRSSIGNLPTQQAQETLNQIVLWEAEARKVARERDDAYEKILEVYKIVSGKDIFTDAGEIRRGAVASAPGLVPVR